VMNMQDALRADRAPQDTKLPKKLGTADAFSTLAQGNVQGKHENKFHWTLDVPKGLNQYTSSKLKKKESMKMLTNLGLTGEKAKLEVREQTSAKAVKKWRWDTSSESKTTKNLLSKKMGYEFGIVENEDSALTMQNSLNGGKLLFTRKEAGRFFHHLCLLKILMREVYR